MEQVVALMSPLFNAFAITGRTALVTGAASGLGKAVARAFAAAGAHVVLFDIDPDGAERVARDLKSTIVITGDVANEDDMARAVETAVTRFGRLDIAALIAGVAARQALADLEEAFLDRLYHVHLKGTALGLKHALRAMVPAGGGAIITCASAAMDIPDEGLGPYAAMKAGICALTRVAAKEGGKQGVRCNAISPGLIETPMTRRYGKDDQGHFDQERFDMFVDTIKKGNALDRIGDTDDIAHAALYLASDASKYVTGQVLRINGGAFMT